MEATPLAPQAGRTGPFTYEDLLEMPDDGRRYEVLEGELHVSPAPSPRHQRVVLHLVQVLVEAERRGYGLVFLAPTEVKLTPTDVAEPDALFITRERAGIVGHRAVEGPPDLVVEVLSEATRRRDVRIKSRVYARHGVRFYWIIDPEEETVRVLEGKDGAFGEPVTLRPGQKLTCPLFPGVEVDVAALFAP